MRKLIIIRKYLLVLVVLLCLASFAKAADKYVVTTYGAIGDGVTNNTKIIQQIIDLCNRNGGGTVYFPSGTFLSGTLFLKDRVFLELDPFAVIKGSSELKDYPDLEKNRKGLIHAVGIQNSGIIGFGTIDANGNDPVFHQGSKSPYRVYAANFENCKDIRIQNVSLINASYWTLRISGCDEVQILGIKIKSTSYFNNDGIDLDGTNIVVADCIIDAIDDGICLKSYYKEKPCENISITNCIISSNCNAIKLGTASEGGFRNIAISNCIIKRPSQNDYFDYKKYTIPWRYRKLYQQFGNSAGTGRWRNHGADSHQ
jgi:polygalacturonase